MHPRRWRERLRQAAADEGLRAVASARLGERNALSGTPLAAGFPWGASLLAAGYACEEDLPDPAFEGRGDAERELGLVELLPADADTDLEQLLLRLGFAPEED